MKPSKTEIETQVNNILESKDFQASSKLSEFLRFVVQETINGNSGQLKGYTIATKVLGRGNEFDQSKDPIVRILASRLRRALEYYYHTNGKSDTVYINIPIGSYIPKFEFSKNGTGNNGTNNHNSGNGLLKEQNKLLIAVLPFKDLSKNNIDELSPEGLAKDIIADLSRFKLLEISALRSNGEVNNYKIYELYQKNGARFLLEGNFKKEKNILKIFTELIDLKLNEVIWVKKFDIKIKGNNLFNIEEKITNKIVPVIGSEYGIISKSIGKELNSKKHKFYHDYEFVQGFYSVQLSLEREKIKDLISAAEKVIKLKPDNGFLHLVAAGLSVFSYLFDLKVVKDPLDYTSEHMVKAFNFEPDNQMVRTMRAAYYFLLDNEKLFKEECELALSLNPTSPYYMGIYGFLLVHTGEYGEGIKYLNSGITLSYNYPSWWNLASAAYYFRNKEYGNAYNESLKINLPDTPWSYIYSIASKGKMRRKEEAKKEICRLKRINPGFNRQANELLGRLIKDTKLLNDLIDGLNKAGLRI